MKPFLLVFFTLAFLFSAFAQTTDYAPASPKPSVSDTDRDSLKKLNLLAYQSKASATISTGQLALSTTAAQVVALNLARHAIVIENHDASISVYVGIAGVTSSTGKIIKAGGVLRINTSAAVFAVSASGTPTISWIAEND